MDVSLGYPTTRLAAKVAAKVTNPGVSFAASFMVSFHVSFISADGGLYPGVALGSVAPFRVSS